jgi:hypothetical protein
VLEGYGLPLEDRKAVIEKAKTASLIISERDIHQHGEACYTSRTKNYHGVCLLSSAKNGCLCCLTRLRMVKAIEQDIVNGKEHDYVDYLFGIQCIADGQFVSEQGRHDADGVKRFPRIYFDLFTLPSKYSALYVFFWPHFLLF